MTAVVEPKPLWWAPWRPKTAIGAARRAVLRLADVGWCTAGPGIDLGDNEVLAGVVVPQWLAAALDKQNGKQGDVHV